MLPKSCFFSRILLLALLGIISQGQAAQPPAAKQPSIQPKRDVPGFPQTPSTSSLLKPPGAAATAQPEQLTLTISGQGTGSAYGVSQKARHQVTLSPASKGEKAGSFSQSATFDAPTMFCFDNSRIYFNVSNHGPLSPMISQYRPAWPFRYGMMLSMTFDRSAKNTIKDAYIYGKFLEGTVQFGNVTGVQDKMAYGPATLAVGTGQLDGNFTRVLNPLFGVPLSIYMMGDTSYSTKISYYSPRIEGFQLGLSFTPSTNHSGEATMNMGGNGGGSISPYDKNNLAMGANYYYKSGVTEFGASVIGMTGSTRGEKTHPVTRDGNYARRNTKALNVGVWLAHAGFEVAAEFIHNYSSRIFSKDTQVHVPDMTQPQSYVASKAEAGKVYAVGLSYSFMGIRASYTYMFGGRKTGFAGKARGQLHSVGVEAKVPHLTGVVLFAEAYHITQKNPDYRQEMALAASFADAKVTSAAPKSPTDSLRSNIIIGGIKVKF